MKEYCLDYEEMGRDFLEGQNFIQCMVYIHTLYTHAALGLYPYTVDSLHMQLYVCNHILYS